jgi:very-short-patch-repair endonuclease
LRLELRAKRFESVKFRRQVVIGPCIADFGCGSPAMLVVERSMGNHMQNRAVRLGTDTLRRACGYRVIHLTNSDVGTTLDGVF